MMLYSEDLKAIYPHRKLRNTSSFTYPTPSYTQMDGTGYISTTSGAKLSALCSSNSISPTSISTSTRMLPVQDFWHAYKTLLNETLWRKGVQNSFITLSSCCRNLAIYLTDIIRKKAIQSRSPRSKKSLVSRNTQANAQMYASVVIFPVNSGTLIASTAKALAL